MFYDDEDFTLIGERVMAEQQLRVQQIGHYRLIRLLGQGGFAEVYLGEHMHLKTL